MRILSLLPSATEIVCALGAEPELVGRSQECDYPPSVARLPVVMQAKTWDSDAASPAIDARVTSARARGESLYRLDLEKIRAVRPEVILTQDLCGVCSVTDSEVREACQLAGVVPRIVSLTPRRLDDVWESIAQVGEAIGRSPEGRRLGDALRERVRREGDCEVGPRRVAVLEWLDPPILAGLWTPDIVEAAGAEYFGPVGGAAGQRLSWDDLARAPPDLAVLAPCSFSVDRTSVELRQMEDRPSISRFVTVVPTYLADEAYFSRPGPRLADGVGLIARLVRDGPPEGPMPVARWRPTAGRVAA